MSTHLHERSNKTHGWVLGVQVLCHLRMWVLVPMTALPLLTGFSYLLATGTLLCSSRSGSQVGPCWGAFEAWGDDCTLPEAGI